VVARQRRLSSSKKVAANLFILQGGAEPLSSAPVWAEPSQLLIGTYLRAPIGKLSSFEMLTSFKSYAAFTIVLECSALVRKAAGSPRCGWYFRNLGILQGRDLPLPLLLHHDQCRSGIYFTRFIAFIELQVGLDEYDGHIWAKKANAPQQETGLASFVDGLKNVPMRGLNGLTPIQLSPKNLDEIGILKKKPLRSSCCRLHSRQPQAVLECLGCLPRLLS
jgi:hypothetical protein